MIFRIWLTERWLEHAEEILIWTGTPPKYTASDYFQKYKWWLRREYQHQFKEVK